jgi:translation initiation factor 2 alpha subunit (eIF-2alpha)
MTSETKDIQFYSTNNPGVGEIVLVKFTKKDEAFFDAVLLEYPYRGIMNYQDATKKRKVKSWNDHVPIGKQMVALVDEIDVEKKIVKLSLAYLDNYVDTPQKTVLINTNYIQQQLIIQFNENKIMESFIKSLCIINNMDIKYIWEKLVHYIDIQRRENNPNDSLWKFFTDNFDNIDEWVKSTNLSITVSDNIKQLYYKKLENNKKITTKISIISVGGINPLKELISKTLKDIEFNYTFKYDTTPTYILESYSCDSSEEDHECIVNNMSALANEYKSPNQIFIKTID